VVTDCSIKTHEAQETLDFEFYGTNVVNKIIMKVDGVLCAQVYLLLTIVYTVCIFLSRQSA